MRKGEGGSSQQPKGEGGSKEGGEKYWRCLAAKDLQQGKGKEEGRVGSGVSGETQGGRRRISRGRKRRRDFGY
ncbi:hypothetical protein ABZP36_006940 [Zizania latifolia]